MHHTDLLRLCQHRYLWFLKVLAESENIRKIWWNFWNCRGEEEQGGKTGILLPVDLSRSDRGSGKSPGYSPGSTDSPGLRYPERNAGQWLVRGCYGEPGILIFFSDSPPFYPVHNSICIRSRLKPEPMWIWSMTKWSREEHEGIFPGMSRMILLSWWNQSVWPSRSAGEGSAYMWNGVSGNSCNTGIYRTTGKLYWKYIGIYTPGVQRV